ncbi:YidH family protein [Pontibacter actiniarum]|uniref:DUF202 domain-containing protein n=1 Tax=Pontibacter actiniarum TaxID=323450 RepID=A0A1X9YW83_9BACT|nr:DUF202 domain-containing protein [Pontibacter actiniarum]ARS37187.1 hypothetical protein CA264_18105 [Pontibacter actiniarum]
MPNADKEKIKKLKKKLKLQEQKNREIRDEMATQRTIFANERTLMAYLRTAMAIVAGGFAAIKFSNDLYLEIAGVVLLLTGLVLALYAFYRYRQKQKAIEGQRQHYAPTSHHHASLHQNRYRGSDLQD